MLLSLPACAGGPNQPVLFIIGENTYYSDGQPVQMDAVPFIENDRSLVPVRYLALSLGVPEEGIVWSPSAQTVTLTTGEVTVVLAVGGNTIYVNGEPREIDVAPVVKNGRTYLPARFVAEAFGYEVGWDEGRQAVLIGPPGQLPEVVAAEPVGAVQAEIAGVIDGDTVAVNLNGREEVWAKMFN